MHTFGIVKLPVGVLDFCLEFHVYYRNSAFIEDKSAIGA